MRRIHAVKYVICLTWLLASPVLQWASAEPAHFWISTSPIDSIGPVALTINRAIGSTTNLYIWVQPETVDVTDVNNGNPYSGANLFKELQNLSLNLVTDAAGIDFLDSGISVYNPNLNLPLTRRFQYDYDSSPNGFPVQVPPLLPLASTVIGGASADKINGIRAFSFGSTATPGYTGYAGIGATCATNDLNLCKATSPGGPPAWLLASIAYKTLQTVGTDVKINLQIGNDGMNHVDPLNPVNGTELSSFTKVKFGTGGTIYNASTMRNMSNAGSPDLTVHACATTPGDYNGNCRRDAADYTTWRDSLGQFGANLPADGSGGTIIAPNGIPDGKVDYADWAFWKSKLPNTDPGAGSGSLDGGSVPEPTTLMLMLIGALAISVRRRAAVK